MLGGLVDEIEFLELKISQSGSYTSPADGRMSGNLEFAYTKPVVDYFPGLGLKIYFRRADALLIDETTVSAYGLPGGGSYTTTFSGTADCDASLMLETVRIYTTSGGFFRVGFASAELFINGSSVHTFTGAIATGGVLTIPSSAPFIGIPPVLSLGDGSIATFYGFDGSVSGGYRIRRDGDWESFPVLTEYTGSLGIGCCMEVPDVYPEGDDTYGMVAKGTFTGTSYSQVGCWPNVPKSVIKFGTDYEALIVRFGLPKVQRGAREECNQVLTPEEYPIDPITSLVEIYPRLTQFLQQVQTTSTTIEEPFDYDTIAPHAIHAASNKDFCGGHVTWKVHNERFPDVVDSMFDNPDMLPAVADYGTQVVAYHNTWASPHWSYFPYFPPDGASSSARWDLDGADSAIDYWFTLRQQHITNPALPSGENSRKRVNVVTEPIDQNGLTGVVQGQCEMPCWWGITGFFPEDEVFPTEFTTNSTSASRFTFPSGTGSVGSDITLSTGTVIAFDLSSYTVYPFMTTTLADRVEFNWTDTNVGAVKPFAVGEDGTRVQIGPATGVVSGVTYRIPVGDSTQWATSAGEEFGAGAITDNYTPDAGVVGSNETFATLSDNERISSFGFLPGFTPVKIEIEITRAGAYTGSVTIDHPTFYMAPFADAKVFHENGSTSTILFKNGPMVRFGVLSFYDWGADTPVSVPTPVSDKNRARTIGDGRCWANCFLKGVDALDDLFAWMIAHFIEDEECTVTKHLWRDPDMQLTSHSFVLQGDAGPVLCYLNSFRCVPPLSAFPKKQRLASSQFQETGAWGMWAYSQVRNKHPHIVPGNVQPELIHGGTNHLAFETAPEGWSVGVFSEAVDNDEDQDWEFKWNETTWFTMRPWRGQIGVYGIPGVEESVMSFDVDHNSHLHVLATVTDAGKVKIGLAGNPLAWEYITTSIDASWVCCRIDRDSQDQAILLLVEDGGSVKLYKSVDRGETFTLSRTVSSGGTPTKPAILVGRNGVRQMYWIDGTDVKGQIADRADNIIESTFTAVAGVEDKGVAVDEDVTETGKKRTLLYVVQGGALTELKSDDGKTFT